MGFNNANFSTFFTIGAYGHCITMISIAIGDKLQTHTATLLRRYQPHCVESPKLVLRKAANYKKIYCGWR